MQLQRVGVGFAGANADHLIQRIHENLAVADLAALGRLRDGLDDTFYKIFRHGDLQLDFRQKVDDIFSAAIQLRVTFLPTESLHFGDGYALHADLGERLAHVVELERLDYRHHHFHASFSMTVAPILSRDHQL